VSNLRYPWPPDDIRSTVYAGGAAPGIALVTRLAIAVASSNIPRPTRADIMANLAREARSELPSEKIMSSPPQAMETAASVPR
jgi:hypothetical protein